MGKYLLVLGIAAMVVMLTRGSKQSSPPTAVTPFGQHKQVQQMAMATFGAGCFWGVEAEFRQLPGVISTTVGYTGGTTPHPSYEQVCGGKTGHTETVEVHYDPAVVSYDTLLDTFWRIHDATEKSKTQYKSVIFYHTPEQRAAAEAAKSRRQQTQTRPLVTEILPAPAFYPAEDYHQQYYEKHGIKGHICGN